LLDRGYYSADLLQLLMEKNIDFIARVPFTPTYIKSFKNEKINDKYVTINCSNDDTIRIRLLKYKLVSNKGKVNYYYLATSLMNKEKYKRSFFIEKYHDRWKIETHFKHLKQELSFNNFRCKKENKLLLEVYSSQLAYTINSYYDHHVTKIRDDIDKQKSITNNIKKLSTNMANKKKNNNNKNKDKKKNNDNKNNDINKNKKRKRHNRKKKTRTKNSLSETMKKILYQLFSYNDVQIKINNIINSLYQIYDSYIQIVPNRSYKKIRKKPKPKFGISGSSSDKYRYENTI